MRITQSELMAAIAEARRAMGDDKILDHRPPGYITAQEFASGRMSISGAHIILNKGVRDGVMEKVKARVNGSGAPVNLYRAKKNASRGSAKR